MGLEAGAPPRALLRVSDPTLRRRWRYPDGAYPWHFTGVELVSYEHHTTLEAFTKDLDRTLDLIEEDWWLVPLTDLHVRREPNRVVNLIAKVLARQEVRLSRVSHG